MPHTDQTEKYRVRGFEALTITTGTMGTRHLSAALHHAGGQGGSQANNRRTKAGQRIDNKLIVTGNSLASSCVLDTVQDY